MDAEFGKFLAGLCGGLAGLLLVIFGVIYVATEWDKHNAPIAFAQCAQMCGPAGVHRAEPSFKCECNETKRFEGSPSLDLNIKNAR